MAFLLDSEELKNGLIIFRRADVKHQNWYCRVKLPQADRYKVVSLKTADRATAREKAFDYDADVRFRLKHNVPIFNRPFSQIADEYLKTQQERAEIGEICADRAAVVGTAVRTLNLYVGTTQIHLIGQDKWNQYPIWRKKHGRRPSGWLSRKSIPRREVPGEASEESKKEPDAKPISNWTIRHEMIVFRSIMAYAASKKYIPESNIFKGKPQAAEERREEFTREEYRILHTKGRAWVKEARTEMSKWYRQMTYNFVLVMCNTGMRPPEAKNLLWRDVSITTIRKDTRGRENKSPEVQFGVEQIEKMKDENARTAKDGGRAAEEEQRKIVVLNVRGKDKNRRLVAPSNVTDYLERIRVIAKVRGPDDYVFSTFAGKRASTLYTSLVRDLFTYAKLLKGPAGTDRSTYSFRHTYATLRLSEGVDSIFLAEQMGTSVQILEEHYGHINPVKNADRILMGMHVWESAPEGASETTGEDDVGTARVKKGAAETKTAKPKHNGKGPRTRN
ncbi:MAG TPA: tyrosine-type recombinase/integrase [Rhizomicrobium sp.]|jgi:integrase|nr:tyrosine-type recombinase/integrase [Rhizomicrobium sp.]